MDPTEAGGEQTEGALKVLDTVMTKSEVLSGTGRYGECWKRSSEYGLSVGSGQTYMTEERNWRTRMSVWKMREARISSKSLTMVRSWV